MISSSKLKISLDRKEAGSDIDFISHAHTDHLAAARRSKMVLASPQTIQLIEQAQGITVQNRADDGKFTLIEAGHMLGSRQLCVDDDSSGKRITYTGDFQTSRSRTSMPIEIRGSDVLIMDSTYADPSVRFDNKDEVESAMQDWANMQLNKGIVIFSAYAMGKAQELISVFNNAGIIPVISKKISRISKVYEKNGVRLDYASMFDPESNYSEIVNGNFLGITESRDLQTLKSLLQAIYKKRVFTAVATGFAKSFRFDADAQFPFSDHADFSQSIEYIEATGADEILTYGPNSASFARNLRGEGYSAVPFAESAIHNQTKNI